MQLISCPWCGPREEIEYHYGGQAHIAYPGDPAAACFTFNGTALSGFADWILLEWGSNRWRTATWHLSLMLSAVVLFAIAAWLQHPGYRDGDVTAGGLIFSLAGLAVLMGGGWLGGAIVFVHGTRVIADDEERTTGGR